MSFINICEDFSTFSENETFLESIENCLQCILLLLNEKFQLFQSNQDDNKNNINHNHHLIHEQFNAFQMEALPKRNYFISSTIFSYFTSIFISYFLIY